MDAPRTHRSPPVSCVHCGQVLPLLRALRSTVCERPACLQHETQAQRRAERQAADEALRRSLRARMPPERAEAVPIVWMQPHGVDLVPLPQAMRDQQTRHLLALAQSAQGTAAAEPEEAGTRPARAEVQICAWCQGRCCRFGKDQHGFITGAHLRRWQQAHAGSSLADAAQAYIDALPERHAQGSCYYHGPLGCQLPREMRSSICNQHVCTALDEVQLHCRSDAGRELLLVMGRREVDAARLVTADGLLPLELPGPPPA